jgi:hypothetical protein
VAGHARADPGGIGGRAPNWPPSPGAPVVSVTGAADLIGRSFWPTNEAMKRLEAAGIVRQVNVGRRNRAFEAPAVIDAFTALERRLASPPARPGPHHPTARRQRDHGDKKRGRTDPKGDFGHSGPRPQPGPTS